MVTPTNFQVNDCDLSDDTLRRYLATPAIAVDTETMGLIPQRDRLCLIQLCDPDGFVTAIRLGIGQTEASNLKQLMESKKNLKIFHYARFDMAQLLYHLKIETGPVFCTKIASKLARTYTSSHGLKSLVQEFEGIELNKSCQSSDWGNVHNLSEAQLNYAANDVLYLLSIQKKLMTMLRREKRWELAQNCFDCLPTFVKLDIEQYRDIFEH